MLRPGYQFVLGKILDHCKQGSPGCLDVPASYTPYGDCVYLLRQWFEPSTAHLNPRSYAVTRMASWDRRATAAAKARGVHTPVHTSH